MSPTSNIRADPQLWIAIAKFVQAGQMAPMFIAAGLMLGACSAPASDAAPPGRNYRQEQSMEQPMKIRIVAGDKALIAELEDSAAGRNFAALLPLDLTLEDYHRTEKISDLPRPLSSEGAPDGITPSAGDLAYYAPWGNLAIFYRGFDYSRGLVRLGRIKEGAVLLSEIEGPVRIERLDD